MGAQHGSASKMQSGTHSDEWREAYHTQRAEAWAAAFRVAPRPAGVAATVAAVD